MWLFWIAIAILAIFLLSIVIRCALGRAYLKRVSRDSLIVFGKKGKGKTLLFSEMTRNAKKGYLSTTDFFHKGETRCEVKDVNCDPNTWENVLNGSIKQIEKREEYEGKPVFLDDAGIFLPNFADPDLKKRYPSLPIAYALWRHFYNAPIHINAQCVDRVYKMLREQADGFIQVRGCMRLFGFAFIRCTFYDRINSAKQELAPMKNLLFNKFGKAEIATFKAMNGTIKDFLIFAPSWRNKYDSRYYHVPFFGKKAPTK